MKRFFTLPKCSSTQMHSNIGAVNAIQNNFVYLHQMGEQIIKKLYIKFIYTSAFIFLQYRFLFQHGKKATKTYIILLPVFVLVQETYYY